MMKATGDDDNDNYDNDNNNKNNQTELANTWTLYIDKWR
jgi:hypothetical protein